jgi:hypothetical protein
MSSSPHHFRLIRRVPLLLALTVPFANAAEPAPTAAEPGPAPAAAPAPSAPTPALDAALQRVLAPHCSDDTAALRSAALQADPRDRAVIERIVRLCAAMPKPSEATDVGNSTPSVDRSGRARLVVGATAYGLWVGIAADVLLEVDDARASVVAPLLGVGAGLGLSLLATAEGEVTKGQAWTVITGLDYGTYSGLLLAGAIEATDEAKDVVGVALTTGLVGGGIGTIAATSFRPTAGDAEVVRSGGLWGFSSAALLALIVQPEDEQTTLGMMLAGMDAGLLTGAVLASESSVSRDRMLLGDAGALAGAVAGVGLGVLVVDTPSEGEGRAVALSTLVGLYAGLGLSLYLTRDMPDETSAEATQARADGHEPPPALWVHEESGRWRAGRLAIQPALDRTRPGVRPVGAWLPLLSGYW